MPSHISQRIASLRELIRGGLHEENLDKIVVECNALAQDTPHVLAFFVLKQVFTEISAALEGEAVGVDQHRELISGLAEATLLILDKIESNQSVQYGELESIVRTHVRNLNVFRSDR